MPVFPTSYDDLINRIGAGQLYERTFQKLSTAPEAAGVWHSFWLANGSPGAGAAPSGTPGTVYDDTAGSVFLPDQASGLKRLVTFGATANQACSLMLYDRLVAVSGLSLASTGNKTVSSSALTRYTDGIGVQAWLEVTTATTVTAPIVDMNSYTNTTPTGSRDGAPITFPAVATNVDAMIGPLPLQSGDVGVTAVSTINVNTAATAGVANLVLLRPIAYLNLPANVWVERDLVRQFPAMPQIYDGASLALMALASGTTAINVNGLLRVAYVTS